MDNIESNYRLSPSYFWQEKQGPEKWNYCLQVTDLLIGNSGYKQWFTTQSSFHSLIADFKSQINVLIMVQVGSPRRKQKVCQIERCPVRKTMHSCMHVSVYTHLHTHMCAPTPLLVLTWSIPFIFQLTPSTWEREKETRKKRCIYTLTFPIFTFLIHISILCAVLKFLNIWERFLWD